MVANDGHPTLGTEDYFSSYPDINVGPVLKAFPDIKVGGVIKLTPSAVETDHNEGDEFDVVVGTGRADTKGMRLAEVIAGPGLPEDLGDLGIGDLEGRLTLRVLDTSFSTLTCMVTSKSAAGAAPDQED